MILRNRSQAGFTLIEGVISLLIMGVLTSLVLVNTQIGSKNQKVRDAGSRFVTAVREAQNSALGLKPVNGETRGAYGVCISSTFKSGPCEDPGSYPADEYQVYARKKADTSYTTRPADADILATHVLTDSATFSTNQLWVDFLPPVPSMLINGASTDTTLSITKSGFSRQVFLRPKVGGIYAQ